MSNKQQFSAEEARSIGTRLGIAWAHLKEIRDYYTRLDRLEAEAERPA
jgi:hypothetical protein